jgi:energy-coupling factor transporter ATP-binding protein EcfA2
MIPGLTRARPAPLSALVCIETRKARVEFPIFDAKSRSLKHTFVGVVGGPIAQNTSRVVVIEALRAITLSLRVDDRVWLVGHNSAGKSTLLRLLSGILGAVARFLLAAGLVVWVGVRPALDLAAIPGLLAALAIVVAACEFRHRVVAARKGCRASPRAWGAARCRDAARVASCSVVRIRQHRNTLLILRATQLLESPERSLTAATSLAILIYAGHNMIAAVASLIAGRWYDHAGPRLVFATGAVAYVLGYGLFAIGGHLPWLIALAFAAARAGIGLAESTPVGGGLPSSSGSIARQRFRGA